MKEENQDRIEEMRTEAKSLVEKHNERVKNILALAEKTEPPRDTIRGEVYELQADEDDVNRFIRENYDLIDESGITEILLSIQGPHRQVLEVIQKLRIGR